ncbi:MAG: translation initiation factor [Planctomycetales bacterium]|nr:translation initiation factor [Planctomycetales bacterium]
MGLFDGTPLERPVICDRCGEEVKQCTCPAESIRQAEVAPADQRLHVSLEKRKRGKVVTVISGLTGSLEQSKLLLKILKQDCSAGGTLEGSQIELQGDHRQRVSQWLRAEGYRLN